MQPALHSPPRPAVRLLPQLADLAARQYGDTPFLLRWTPTGWEPWSFAEAARRMHAFTALLEREGVRPIPSEGREFDPFDMEAVMRAPSEEVPAGHVLRELQCGYKGRGRVLRPCKVIVSAGPPTEAGRVADVDDAQGEPRTQPQSRSKSPSQSPSPTQSQSQSRSHPKE